MSAIKPSISHAWLIIILGLSLLLAACGATETEPDACDAPGILFFDDFNGEFDCGWAVFSRPGGAAALENAAMRLTVSQPGQMWWSNPGREFADVVINAEARQVDGSNDNAYGLICRYQNEENFYVFLVSGDGYYTIAKYQSGTENVIYLTEGGQFQPSDVINIGVASNELRATCAGPQLSLEVNGVPLVSVTDPTFVTGDIGVAAGTLAGGNTVIEFDNVQVIAP